MSALEDSLRKVYKLPTMPAGSSMDSGFDISLPPMTPEQQAMAKRMGKQFSVTPENMQPMTPEQKEYMQRMSVSPTAMMQRGQVSEQELDMMVDDLSLIHI